MNYFLVVWFCFVFDFSFCDTKEQTRVVYAVALRFITFPILFCIMIYNVFMKKPLEQTNAFGWKWQSRHLWKSVARSWYSFPGSQIPQVCLTIPGEFMIFISLILLCICNKSGFVCIFLLCLLWTYVYTIHIVYLL